MNEITFVVVTTVAVSGLVSSDRDVVARDVLKAIEGPLANIGLGVIMVGAATDVPKARKPRCEGCGSVEYYCAKRDCSVRYRESLVIRDEFDEGVCHQCSCGKREGCPKCGGKPE